MARPDRELVFMVLHVGKILIMIKISRSGRGARRGHAGYKVYTGCMSFDALFFLLAILSNIRPLDETLEDDGPRPRSRKSDADLRSRLLNLRGHQLPNRIFH